MSFRAATSPPVFLGQTTSAIAANTTINWTAIEDPYVMNSAGTLTIKLGGLYMVTVQGKQNGATALNFGVYVQLNGTSALFSPAAPAANFAGASLSQPLRCAVGDTLVFKSSLAFTPQNDLPAFSTFASVVWLRP